MSFYMFDRKILSKLNQMFSRIIDNYFPDMIYYTSEPVITWWQLGLGDKYQHQHQCFRNHQGCLTCNYENGNIKHRHHTHHITPIFHSQLMARDLPHRLVPDQNYHLANEEDKSSSNYKNKPGTGLSNKNQHPLAYI